MDTLLQDLRYSIRLLWKKPGFAAVVILTLALGIGANTAVFTVINALMLRPLPYPEADRLAFLWESRLSDPGMEDSLSPHNFTDLRQRAHSLQSCFAFRYGTFNLTAGGQPEALNGVLASADFGRTMGIHPQIGRMFGADEDRPGKNRAVVLSDGLWRRRFGGDPQIPGTQVRLNGESYTVLGVMPPDFQFPNPEIELWVPLALDLSKFQRGTSFLTGVARVNPDVSLKAAGSEALQVGGQIRKDFPEVGTDFSFLLEPFRDHLYGKMQRPLMILFGSVALVLLIACVNVANLMLGRASSRSREIAVRSALGASRAGLVRLLLLEGVLLALLAGAAGILLATYGIQILVSIYPAAIPAGANPSIDLRVIAFTVLVSALTGVLFALAPAWHAAQSSLSQTLQESGRTVSGARRVKVFRSALVVTELCLSLVLLVGAGLLLKSLWKELAVNPGFQARNVVTCMISLPQSRYGDANAQTVFFRSTLEAMRRLPDVESVALATSLPFSGSRGVSSFSIDGRPEPDGGYGPEADRHQVSPGYFRTMGIPLLSGRDFAESDDISKPQVVIINAAAARRFWPSENPIGKRITIGMPEEKEIYGKAVSREIVGIVGNVKHEDLKDDFKAEMYIPAWQLPSSNMTLVVRAQAAAGSVLSEVRQVVGSVDPDQPIRRVKLLDETVARSVAPQRFLASLLMFFAGLALLLALIGIYAVMSFSVAQRVQEIGVRMALGATAGDVLSLVFRQGLLLAALGTAAGLSVTLILTRVMKTLLFEVSATDPETIAMISIVLLLVTLAACLIPARRATRVDPTVALRYE